jgi:hypothetical protein
VSIVKGKQLVPGYGILVAGVCTGEAGRSSEEAADDVKK